MEMDLSGEICPSRGEICPKCGKGRVICSAMQKLEISRKLINPGQPGALIVHRSSVLRDVYFEHNCTECDYSVKILVEEFNALNADKCPVCSAEEISR